MVRHRIHFNGNGRDSARRSRWNARNVDAINTIQSLLSPNRSPQRIGGKILGIIQKHRLRIRKSQKGSKEDDFVIALLGPTGSGRSTFIGSICGPGAPLVGDALGSCTTEIVPARFRDQESGRNVVLLDTPGFNNTLQFDHNLDILEKISHWLRSKYTKHKRLSKILYFHRITDNRTPGTLLVYLRMFRKLLGEDRLGNVYLITTMWDLVEASIGEERLQELEENDWKAIIGQGAHISRCRSDNRSANGIIRQIVDDKETSKDNIGTNDIVIAVMGATGSGKSAFIRSASGSETLQVSGALRSVPTNKVVAIKCEEQMNEKCIVLLDTPGFGGSDPEPKTARDSLKMTSEWLELNHTKHLSGILYLHQITDNRIAGTPLESHPAFLRKLLPMGDKVLDKVYLTTTMWDEVEENVGESRLEELKSTHWKKMIDQGAKVCCVRADNSPKDILCDVLRDVLREEA